MSITCEKLTQIVETLKKKFLERGVCQVFRPNLYKSWLQYSYPLYLFIYVNYLFMLCLHLFFTLNLFFLMLTLCSSFKIVLNNCFYQSFCNWIFFQRNTISILCLESLVRQIALESKFCCKTNCLLE